MTVFGQFLAPTSCQSGSTWSVRGRALVVFETLGTQSKIHRVCDEATLAIFLEASITAGLARLLHF